MMWNKIFIYKWKILFKKNFSFRPHEHLVLAFWSLCIHEGGYETVIYKERYVIHLYSHLQVLILFISYHILNTSFHVDKKRAASVFPHRRAKPNWFKIGETEEIYDLVLLRLHGHEFSIS